MRGYDACAGQGGQEPGAAGQGQGGQVGYEPVDVDPGGRTI